VKRLSAAATAGLLRDAVELREFQDCCWHERCFWTQLECANALMRIRVKQRPTATSIDGIRLDRFEPGFQYEVGNGLGALFLAEGWAEPVPFDEPALLIPFSETDPHGDLPFRDADAPRNLTREHYPPYLNDRLDVAADFSSRNRQRKKPSRA
jgi:hypothetical protein